MFHDLLEVHKNMLAEVKVTCNHRSDGRCCMGEVVHHVVVAGAVTIAMACCEGHEMRTVEDLYRSGIMEHLE